VLIGKSDLFAQVVIEKLLTYAMGRGVEYQDMPTVRSIARSAENSNYEFSSILLGIIDSPAFQMNQTTAERSEE
jgi:hypothetical protein